MQTSLPVDVLLLIVDAIDDGPKQHATLRACALTCQAMRRAAQARLFSSIRLNDRNVTFPHDGNAQPNTFIPFAQIIAESPALAALVKSLDIGDFNTEMTDFPLPPHIITRLIRLESLTFDSCGTYEGRKTHMVAYFFKLFGSLTTLTDVTFSSVMFSTLVEAGSVVWSFPYVQSLTFSACMFDEVPMPHDFTMPDERYYPGRGLNSLRTLSWETNYFFYLNLSLSMWGSGVRNLIITGEDAEEHDTLPLVGDFSALSAFPHLESLELELSSAHMSTSSSISDIIRYLATDNLRNVTVTHYICYPKTLDDILNDINSFHLDELLREPAFRHLERLLWSLIDHSNPPLADLADRVRAIVPRASQRGVFVVKG